MQHLGLLFTLTVLAVNIWGMTLVAGSYWRNCWFALATGPLFCVTIVYAIECHHGLGPSLAGLGLLSSVLSVALISFSLGVEIGHQIVVIPFYMVLRLIRKYQDNTRQPTVMALCRVYGSWAICIAGGYFLFQALQL